MSGRAARLRTPEVLGSLLPLQPSPGRATMSGRGSRGGEGEKRRWGDAPNTVARRSPHLPFYSTVGSRKRGEKSGDFGIPAPLLTKSRGGGRADRLSARGITGSSWM